MSREDRWSLVAGRQPVREALLSGREIREVLLAEGVKPGSVKPIEDLARKKGIPLRRIARAELNRLTRLDVVQGVAAWIRAIEYTPLEDIVASAKGQSGLIVVCDGIEDPHNLGAIIRTADAAGAHGVVVPKRRAVGLTETVVKASAGAALHVPVARVTNVARTITLLKEEGYWAIGADMDGETPLWEADFTSPVALVIGGEGKGLSRLTAQLCDVRVSIPMLGNVNSLNASVAAAILLYEVVRQRR